MNQSLTVSQITRAFRAVIGHDPRAADIGVVTAMGGTDEVLADYLWDHWLGEPDEPSQPQVLAAIQVAVGQRDEELRKDRGE